MPYYYRLDAPSIPTKKPGSPSQGSPMHNPGKKSIPDMTKALKNLDDILDYAMDVYGGDRSTYWTNRNAIDAQYDYNQKRKNAGLKPLAIADPQWNPTAQDDDANEVLAQWYSRHGSLPRGDQQVGFNRLLKLYRAEKRMHGGDGEARPVSSADPLAGGLSRLKGNEGGARLQNLYSGSTAAALQAINNQADERARQKAESGKGNPSIYMANEDQRQDDQKRRQANLAAAAKAWELENPTLNPFTFPSVEKAAAMVAAQNQPGKTSKVPSDTQSTEDPGPVLGRILSFETGLVNGSAGWAIDLQNTINQNNTPSLGNGLQPYNEVKDTLQKKYPGAFLAGDLTGMVASGYFYGTGSKTADALEAASRKMAPEVVESIAGQKFGKQILRGASVAERAAADEAAVKAAHALAENNATNSPLLAALDDVIARNPGLARQAAGSYTHGASAADDAYQAYLRMLDEAEQANKAGMAARDFAKSKGIQSTLTDQQAAFLDRNRIKMLSEDAGKLPQGIDKQSFETASKHIRDTVGDISDDIVVQGSRAAGTARADSDIDFAIRVSKDQFDAFIKQYFKTPNPGSAAERTLLRAIESGKIQAGEAKLSGLRKMLKNQFGMNVDISIILKDGPFDNGPYINLP